MLAQGFGDTSVDEVVAASGSSKVDLEAIADHVFVTFEGAFIRARTMEDGSHMRRQLALLRTLLELLLGVRAQAAGG